MVKIVTCDDKTMTEAFRQKVESLLVCIRQVAA